MARVMRLHRRKNGRIDYRGGKRCILKTEDHTSSIPFSHLICFVTSMGLSVSSNGEPKASSSFLWLEFCVDIERRHNTLVYKLVYVMDTRTYGL